MESTELCCTRSAQFFKISPLDQYLTCTLCRECPSRRAIINLTKAFLLGFVEGKKAYDIMHPAVFQSSGIIPFYYL